ncbi:MAG: type II toxin-antitoxin system Phd/YefM family antitoxin [Myxococcales bacterium]|nr:type II toxin-antitoxin system Phd/YefM family antitoxin [Myxococcales bacterium]
MDASKDVEPITTLKREASQLIERARDRGAPILITQGGKPTAVLQDVESFERKKNALLLLKLLAQGERDYDGKRILTRSEAKRRFRDRLAELARSK